MKQGILIKLGNGCWEDINAGRLPMWENPTLEISYDVQDLYIYWNFECVNKRISFMMPLSFIKHFQTGLINPSLMKGTFSNRASLAEPECDVISVDLKKWHMVFMDQDVTPWILSFNMKSNSVYYKKTGFYGNSERRTTLYFQLWSDECKQTIINFLDLVKYFAEGEGYFFA